MNECVSTAAPSLWDANNGHLAGETTTLFNLNNYLMDCRYILSRHSWCPEDEAHYSDVIPTFHLAPPAGQMYYLSCEVCFKIDCTDTRGSQRVNPSDLGAP